MTARNESRYQQLLTDGFCIFENVVDINMLDALRQRTDLPSLPEKIQAQMAAKTQTIPDDWDVKTRAKVEAIMPRYEGDAVADGRQLYRPKA